MIHGVDVSSYQPGWKPADADLFVFVKSTQGTNYSNPQRVAQLKAARAGGLVVGHYHYIIPGNAVAQARYFAANTDIHAGDLLACDWEGIWKKGTHASVEDAAAFIAEVKRLLPENKVGLYCNRSDWMSTTVKAGDFLWIAEYGVSKPNTKTKWDFWQYSDTPIDQNKARFETVAELRSWAAGKPKPPSPPKPVTRVWWHGGWVSVTDAVILDAVQEAMRGTWGTINLSQGGDTSSEPKSAKTHDKLAVWDVKVSDPKLKSQSLVWSLCKAFLRAGVVPFPRGYGDGMTPKHIHCVSQESIGQAHREAQDQLNSRFYGYLHKVAGKRGAGLAGAKWRRYIGPTIALERWKDSPYNPVNVKDDNSIYYVDVSEGSSLIGNNVDRVTQTTHERGTPITVTKQVRRWGRWNAVTANGIYYAIDFLTKEKPV